MAITELRIEGLRTLADVRLGLRELTVLIGANGSGKSSLLEACELLRKAPSADFFKEFRRSHWGFSGLLRHGAPHLKLGVRIEEAEEAFEYEFAIADRAGSAVLIEEKLTLGPDAQHQSPVVVWHLTDASIRMQVGGKLVEVSGDAAEAMLAISPNRLLVMPDSSRASVAKLAQKVARALESIEVQLPFEVLPSWAGRSFKRSSALRDDNIIEPVDRLETLGTNLTAVYYALKNEYGDSYWRETLELVRLGLGEEVEDLRVVAGSDGGKVSLRLKYRAQPQPIPSFALSDGTLAYLAWVALYRIRRPIKPALLVFDEPELHLHPHLLMRVLDFLESLGQEFPVLIATHSDRLLDALSKPAEQVVLCELDPSQATQLRRPDAAALRQWLLRYRGLGELRSEGHDASIWSRDEAPAEQP